MLESFNKRVREVFLEVNMTQEEFANEVGLSQSQVHRILNGKRAKRGSLYTAIKIAEAYGYSVDWLLGLSSKKYLDKRP